ncbi:MAG: hypothetical protein ABIU63_07605 [Chitinophagaceae bacterium]
MYSLSNTKRLGFFLFLPLFVCSSAGAMAQDNDQDGIPDALERQLLERFRPFFKFSNDGGDDNFRPADIWWYLTKSEMLTNGDENSSACISNRSLASNPLVLLFDKNAPCAKFKSDDITQNPTQTGYHINPVNNVNGEGNDPGRHGNDWNTVKASKRTGLYGHVTSIRLSSRFVFSFDQINNGSLTGNRFYKIEYWQFFGYNSANKTGDIGDHEGDWASVQLIYDPTANLVRSIFHFAHGLLFRFDLTPANTARIQLARTPAGMVKEFDGVNFTGQDLELSHLVLGGIPPKIVVDQNQVARAQNNMVRVLQDGSTKEFSHPVVYIENGTHEFFPTEKWKYYGAPNHNGESFNYLTNTPPNLGEAEFPLNEDRAAQVILKFNGFWGTYGKYNDPPLGPILHKNWLWPATSSVRWLITKQLGF